MNMFRDLMILLLLGLGAGLTFTDPLDWKWVASGGPYFVQGITYLVQGRPFTPVICFALALALFMTRLKY